MDLILQVVKYNKTGGAVPILNTSEIQCITD